jgi:hypothetical protein
LFGVLMESESDHRRTRDSPLARSCAAAEYRVSAGVDGPLSSIDSHQRRASSHKGCEILLDGINNSLCDSVWVQVEVAIVCD